MTRSPYAVVGGFCFLALVVAHAQRPQEASNDRYRLLSTARTSTLEKELNVAASSHRLVMAWDLGLTVLLERAQGGRGREFRLIAALALKTLNSELIDAAADGFRLVPGGLLRNTALCCGDMDHETVLLLEREPGATAEHEYVVTAPETIYEWNPSTKAYATDVKALASELRQRPQEGYRLAGLMGRTASVERQTATCFSFVRTRCRIQVVRSVLVWERPTDKAKTSPVAVSEQSGRYRHIEGAAGPELQRGVVGAASDGYRVIETSRFDVRPKEDDAPNQAREAVIMERTAEPDRAYQYVVLMAFDPEGLENQMNAAGARGYRVHSRAVHGDPLVMLMERAPDEHARYSYVITRASQQELNEASASGYAVVAATDSSRQVYDISSDPGGVQSVGRLFGARPNYRVAVDSPVGVGFLERRSDPIPGVAAAVGGEPRTVSLQIQANPGDMQKDLNAAARDGYRLWLLGASPNGDRVEATFLKRLETEGPYEYRVLTTSRDSSLQSELNEAAGAGFQLVRGGVFVKPTRARGLELAAVMERASERQRAYEYVVLSTQREATLKKEVGQAIAQGYEAVARLSSRGDLVTFLERSASLK